MASEKRLWIDSASFDMPSNGVNCKWGASIVHLPFTHCFRPQAMSLFSTCSELGVYMRQITKYRLIKVRGVHVVLGFTNHLRSYLMYLVPCSL